MKIQESHIGKIIMESPFENAKFDSKFCELHVTNSKYFIKDKLYIFEISKTTFDALTENMEEDCFYWEHGDQELKNPKIIE